MFFRSCDISRMARSWLGMGVGLVLVTCASPLRAASIFPKFEPLPIGPGKIDRKVVAIQVKAPAFFTSGAVAVFLWAAVGRSTRERPPCL